MNYALTTLKLLLLAGAFAPAAFAMEWRGAPQNGNIEDRRKDAFYQRYGHASKAWRERNIKPGAGGVISRPTHNGALVRIRYYLEYEASVMRELQNADDSRMDMACYNHLQSHHNGFGLVVDFSPPMIVVEVFCANIWLGPVLRWEQLEQGVDRLVSPPGSRCEDC